MGELECYRYDGLIVKVCFILLYYVCIYHNETLYVDTDNGMGSSTRLSLSKYSATRIINNPENHQMEEIYAKVMNNNIGH